MIVKLSPLLLFLFSTVVLAFDVVDQIDQEPQQKIYGLVREVHEQAELILKDNFAPMIHSSTRSKNKRASSCGSSDDDEIDDCGSCSIISKWHNDVTYDNEDQVDNIFEKVVLKQVWEFMNDHGLEVEQTYKFFVTRDFAKDYNTYAKNNDCEKIDYKKWMFRIKVTYLLSYDFSDCELTTCESDTECEDVRFKSQKKLCLDDFGTDDLSGFDCSFAATLFGNIDEREVEFRDNCQILDLFPETDNDFWVFEEGSATSLAVSFSALFVGLFFQFFFA
mmetsp:Transcript_26695/g.37201  ORF Transcript_26695/g.37201 Transcript_26695/m.37201 type:complete len:277 (+) Transcript_26695:32-862(+)